MISPLSLLGRWRTPIDDAQSSLVGHIVKRYSKGTDAPKPKGARGKTSPESTVPSEKNDNVGKYGTYIRNPMGGRRLKRKETK